MKRLLLVILLNFILAGFAQAAVEVGGVRFEDKSRVADSELQLNGAGLRSRFFINVYAVGLYLGEKKTNAGDTLAAPGAKRLQLQLLRDLTATQFVDALVESFHKNNDNADAEPLKSRLEELKASMLSIGSARKGDVINIDWLPAQGMRLTLNGKAVGKDISGEEFYRAMMKIWLGNRPVQDSVKDALLGKPQ